MWIFGEINTAPSEFNLLFYSQWSSGLRRETLFFSWLQCILELFSSFLSLILYFWHIQLLAGLAQKWPEPTKVREKSALDHRVSSSFMTPTTFVLLLVQSHQEKFPENITFPLSGKHLRLKWCNTPSVLLHFDPYYIFSWFHCIIMLSYKRTRLSGFIRHKENNWH